MVLWVKENLTSGRGAYVGYIKKKELKKKMKGSIRIKLYPAFIVWCQKFGYTPLSHVKFSGELIKALKMEGYSCAVIRRKQLGTFIEGVELKKDVLDRSLFHEAPVFFSRLD
jgi:Poxvirus D5 protein-like